MMNDNVAANRARVERLSAKGVNILAPESVIVGEEVNPDNVEAGVVVGPGTKILGAETMIGAGTEIQGSAVIKNSQIGRNCSLAAGEYIDSVLLDGCSTVGWARVRGNSAWEEESNSAHNCDTKTTILGYKTTLGSLINFCNVLMLGGTSPRLKVGSEVGSGVINFNFLPYGATMGALIKPSTVLGSMESPFLVCDGAPTRYLFIGGHTSIIAPTVIGLETVVAATTRLNPGIYGEGKLISGGNREELKQVDVARVRVLKGITPKYKILIHQIATAVAYRKWCDLRVDWANRNLDEFEVKLMEGFAAKVDKYIEALEAYGDNIAKYLLASDDNSRPDSLVKNKAIATRWNEKVKAQIKAAVTEETGYAEATAGLNSELDRVTQEGAGRDKQFYDTLAKLSYLSTEVKAAREYFSGLVETIVRQART